MPAWRNAVCTLVFTGADIFYEGMPALHRDRLDRSLMGAEITLFPRA
jgi:hypothetical protein